MVVTGVELNIALNVEACDAIGCSYGQTRCSDFVIEIVGIERT